MFYFLVEKIDNRNGRNLRRVLQIPENINRTGLDESIKFYEENEQNERSYAAFQTDTKRFRESCNMHSVEQLGDKIAMRSEESNNTNDNIQPCISGENTNLLWPAENAMEEKNHEIPSENFKKRASSLGTNTLVRLNEKRVGDSTDEFSSPLLNDRNRNRLEDAAFKKEIQEQTKQAKNGKRKNKKNACEKSDKEKKKGNKVKPEELDLNKRKRSRKKESSSSSSRNISRRKEQTEQNEETTRSSLDAEKSTVVEKAQLKQTTADTKLNINASLLVEKTENKIQKTSDQGERKMRNKNELGITECFAEQRNVPDKREKKDNVITGKLCPTQICSRHYLLHLLTNPCRDCCLQSAIKQKEKKLKII